MRFVTILAAFAALCAVFATALPEPAQAGFRDRGWGERRVVTHRVYRPRYVHVYRYRRGHGDPYAYRYEPRGYYPYYNSRYWKPPQYIRRPRHYRQPPYYKAWGYPKRGYRHREWHHRNHGRIRRHHW